MPVSLVIRDGTPYWWNSPDIWVVPGNDPNGTPGSPVAGQPAFVWARVQNQGDVPALGAQVKYYWANPAAGVLRSNSTLIGSAFVDLGPGEVKGVLCVVPWIPVIVNGGHECLVAEVIHYGDPLPAPPPDDFNPPLYHQIAQKNLTVLAMMKRMQLLPIEIAAPLRQGKLFVVTLELGGELNEELLCQLGLPGRRPYVPPDFQVSLSLKPGCEDADTGEWMREVELKLGPGERTAVYLAVRPPKMPAQTYTLIQVVSRERERLSGGVTFVLVDEEG